MRSKYSSGEAMSMLEEDSNDNESDKESVYDDGLLVSDISSVEEELYHSRK